MKYPINYDFGANWKEQVVNILDDIKIDKALQKINKLYTKYHSLKRNPKTPCISELSRGDSWVMIKDRKEEIEIERLRKLGKLTDEFLRVEERFKNMTEDTDDEQDFFDEYQEEKDTVLEEYNLWKDQKYNLENYQMVGYCHIHAPTIGLTLAKLVCPNEKWRLITSDKHTSVINKDNTKVFDLLFWCLDGRLENYMFGDLLEEIDNTMGGKTVYEMIYE